MSSKSVFHYVGIGALIWVVFKHFGGSIARRFNLGNVRMSNYKITTNGLEFSVDVPINNKTPINVPVEAFNGLIRYGNKPVAVLDISNPITIKAGGSHIYKVDGIARFENLATGLVDIIQNKDFENQLFLDAQVISSGFNYRFTEPIFVP